MQIRCFKSEIHEGYCDIEIDHGTTLSEVRILLLKRHFIENDQPEKKLCYRFINKAVMEKEFVYTDVIVGIGLEKILLCTQIMDKGNNTLVLTNTAKTNNADLIGFKTDWWAEGYVKAQCYLNRSNENAKKDNARIPFEPVMLNNVISTNPNIKLPFTNACICCEGSVVGFNINSWGAAGYVVQIGSDVGEKIMDWGMRGTGKNPNTYQTVNVAGWQDGTKNIKVVALENLKNLVPGVDARYQKITFKTSRITSYKNSDGIVYHSETMPPEITLKCATRSLKSILVPGDSEKPAAPIPDKPSGTKYTGHVSDVKWDGWEKLLGKIEVYFFVFNSWDDAEKVIESLNCNI